MKPARPKLKNDHTSFLPASPLSMNRSISTFSVAPVLGLLLSLNLLQSMPALAADATASASPSTKSRPALTVQLTQASSAEWEQTLSAHGSVTAWQEAIIGAEIAGLRLADVKVQVGDRIKRGQLLAQLSDATVRAELAQSRAAAAEAQALLQSAQGDAERARALQAGGSGALSAQQLAQYLTAEQTAKARLDSAQARVASDELRLAQTRIIAPDEGIISARLATVGGVVQPGQELFHLIRQGRLEWRAELPAADLARVRPGLPVQLAAADGSKVPGKVRVVAPTVDAQTRMGLVYVDLSGPGAAQLRAGSFARGEIQLGRGQALSLPQSAVQLRDGNSYVFRVGKDQKVQQIKVSTGRRNGDRVELLGGLEPGAAVVQSGVSFLSDGDSVRVVAASAPAAKP